MESAIGLFCLDYLAIIVGVKIKPSGVYLRSSWLRLAKSADLEGLVKANIIECKVIY